MTRRKTPEERLVLDWEPYMPALRAAATEGRNIAQAVVDFPPPYNDPQKAYGVARHQGIRFRKKRADEIVRGPSKPWKTNEQKAATKLARKLRRRIPNAKPMLDWEPLIPLIHDLAAMGLTIREAVPHLPETHRHAAKLRSIARVRGVKFAAGSFGRIHGHSLEERAASSERMRRMHQDPAFHDRVMKALWAGQREALKNPEYVAMVSETAKKHVAISLHSEKAIRNKIRANRWIMKRAQALLNEDPAHGALFTETQARLRIEHPYNGDGDYYAYLSELGAAVCNDPDYRRFCNAFMREAIPKASREWQAKK